MVRLCTSTAGGAGSTPGQGTKIPQATWHSQKKKKINVQGEETAYVKTLRYYLPTGSLLTKGSQSNYTCLKVNSLSPQTAPSPYNHPNSPFFSHPTYSQSIPSVLPSMYLNSAPS